MIDGDSQVPGAPSDNTTLTTVLQELASDGWTGDVDARHGGRVRWRCGHEVDAADVRVGTVRRLEGASDPDDMLAVVGMQCPHCGARGVLVARYGPMADEDDADVLTALTL